MHCSVTCHFLHFFSSFDERLSNCFLCFFKSAFLIQIFLFLLTNILYLVHDSYPKGLIVAFKLKKKQDDKPLEQNSENKINENKGGSTSEEVEDTGNEENKEKGEEVGKLSDVNIENDENMTEGLPEKIEEEATDEAKHDAEDKEDKSLPVDKSKNRNDASIVTREDIKQLLKKFGAIKVFHISSHDFVIFPSH